GRRYPEGVQVTQAVALPGQLVPLPHVGLRGLDLSQLKVEQVELALSGPRQLAELLPLVFQRPDADVGLGHLLPQRQRPRPAVTVQDLQLYGAEHQLSMLVLTV